LDDLLQEKGFGIEITLAFAFDFGDGK